MKKGQIGLGLVIFAIVAIIAVIGLVLLFTRASESTGAAIGQSYNQYWQYLTQDEGIVKTHPQSGPLGTPEVERPALLGTLYAEMFANRIPAFMIGGGAGYQGYARFPDDAGQCWEDLRDAYVMANPESFFSCFSVPYQGTSSAEGNFPSDNAGRARPTSGEYKSLRASGPYGGDGMCYAHTTGTDLDSDKLIREHIIEKLVNTDKWDYYHVVMFDGSIVKLPVCSVSRKVFPFTN